MSDELQFAHYPFEDEGLPESWEITALENVLENIRPGFASGQHNKDGEGIPHLRPMNISPSGSIDLSEVRYVQGDHSLRLQKGDVLFNNTNSTVWVGKTALIETDDDLAFSNHMTRLRISSAIDPMFVAKQLHFLCSQGYFRHHCKKHVNQASIATDFLSRCVPVRIPPAAEQRRIVAKIGALQERSRQARAVLAEMEPLLEQLRHSVLAAAFRGDLTAVWRASHPNVKPASELLHRIRAERRRHWEQAELDKYEARDEKPPKNWRDKYKEPEPVDNSDLSTLPEGWCWAGLEELKDFSPNSMTDGPFGSKLKTLHYSDSGIRVVRLGNIGVGHFNASDEAFIPHSRYEELKKHEIFAGDLVIAALAEPVGRCCKIPPSIGKAIVKADCIRFRPYPSVLPEIVMHWLNSGTGRRLAEIASHGIGRLRINMENLRSLPVALPPVDEQIEMVTSIAEQLAGIARIEAQVSSCNEDLDQLDQAILAQAFRGELVSQDLSDEPASALLERIRRYR